MENVQNNHDDDDIIKRLYMEVRYARHSCLSMKPTASVFRLKRAFKKLSSQEYADNLREYLGDARKKTNLTESDLEAILELMSDQDSHQPTTQQASTSQNTHEQAENRGKIVQNF